MSETSNENDFFKTPGNSLSGIADQDVHTNSGITDIMLQESCGLRLVDYVDFLMDNYPGVFIKEGKTINPRLDKDIPYKFPHDCLAGDR